MSTGKAATLSSKFQIVIPKAICAANNWRAGQKFAFVPKGNGVLLLPAPSLEQLCGIARGANAENVRNRNDRF